MGQAVGSSSVRMGPNAGLAWLGQLHNWGEPFGFALNSLSLPAPAPGHGREPSAAPTRRLEEAHTAPAPTGVPER